MSDPISRRFATQLLRRAGWKLEGERPDVKKCVCIAAPHTSNWDGVWLVAFAQSLDLPLSFMIKDSWLKPPMGAWMRRMGAVGIDRSGPHNVVESMVRAFAERDELILTIPPEGTRGRSDYWKSGFYHIARGADVPVVPGFLDFARKRGGFGPTIDLTGDVSADMDRIRAFYEKGGYVAHSPSLVGPMRLRDEE